jgi:hypothetical protein
MKAIFAALGLTTVLLGACAHEGYARRECGDCHRRCEDEERACGERHERDCGERRRGCEDSCKGSDMCR